MNAMKMNNNENLDVNESDEGLSNREKLENQVIEETQEEEKTLRKDVEHTQSAAKEMETASAISKEIEAMPDPVVQRGINKILNKCLDAHPGLQEKFSGRNIAEYKEKMLQEHPELWGVLTINMGINDLSSENYDALQPMEKIKLLAIDGAINDILPLEFNMKNEDGSFNKDTIKSRYNQKLQQRMENILSTFRWDQRFNNLSFGSVDELLQDEYGFTAAESEAFKKYLEKVKEKIDNTITMEKSSWKFGLGVLTGVLISAAGYIVYNNIFNPSSSEVIEKNKITLGTPNEIAKLLTAQQEFSVSGEITEEMYNTTGDSSLLGNLKKVANIFQSREITMTLDGKIAVEYDLQEGASFIFNKETQTIEVNLPSPKLKVIDKNHTVTDRNEEYINLQKFDNTEKKLIEHLSKKALEESADEEKLIKLSMQQTANIMEAIYAPILRHFGEEVKGIEINIKQSQQDTSIDGEYRIDGKNHNSNDSTF